MIPRLLAVLLALALLATGCSKDSGGDGVSPEQRLAAAKKKLDATTGVRIGLSTERLPAGTNGLVRADGVGTHAPAFKGDITVAVSGVNADAAVVAVDGKVYAKLPFTSSFAQIDPADYGAPDPAALMAQDGGLSSLLTEAKDVTEGDQVRSGKRVLTTYHATVPGSAVAAVIPSASESADFDATFTVDDQDRLAGARLTGPFYPKAGDVTYEITFDGYGVSEDIKAP
ncbi:MAG: LppX_LprAFG lipoprotein [Nocardioidaceae bacterium]|nr:LppX_LprAFG lipoprotein [Nocardioidaceae bacterium]NUS51978.1 LppX_LprAFG lipoprotein [Nocardioidaceae bacterium]